MTPVLPLLVRSYFSSLAVDASDIFGVEFEPVVQVLAELVHQGHTGRLVVVEGELGHFFEKGMRVLPLRTEVINFIVVLVPFREEPLHISHRVPVEGFDFLGRESHRDYPFSNVGQVQIEAIIGEPQLLLRNQ